MITISQIFLFPIFRKLFSKKYNLSAEEQIKRSFEIIDYVFKQNEIINKSYSVVDIINYYIDCFDVYTRVHSKDGAMHWRLNFDGKLKDSDVYNTTILIKQIIDSHKCHKILELGVGKGFNLKYLNQESPNLNLHGLDITPKNALTAQNMVPDAEIKTGNFDELIPFPDESMNFIFNVESFCYSVNHEKFFSEISRVLKNNGKLLIVDAFYKKSENLLSVRERVGRALICKCMMCNDGSYVESIISIAQKYQLKLVKNDDYTYATRLQSLKFEHMANNIFRFKFIAREWLIRHSGLSKFNLIAALLARSFFEKEILSYNFLLFEKIS